MKEERKERKDIKFMDKQVLLSSSILIDRSTNRQIALPIDLSNQSIDFFHQNDRYANKKSVQCSISPIIYFN